MKYLYREKNKRTGEYKRIHVKTGKRTYNQHTKIFLQNHV